MRIAYITHYAELYGANRSLFDLVRELRDHHGIGPHLLVPREGPLTARATAEGIPWCVVPWEGWMSERHYMGRAHHRLLQYLRHERAARARRARNRAVMPRIMAQLKRWRIDVVHVNSAAVGITPGLLEHWRGPLVWHIREMPEAHYRLHLDAGRKAYGRALRRATRLIAISRAVQADIRRYAGNVESTLIYNGVLPAAGHRALAARCHERWGTPLPFTFVIAGLIHPGKGQEEAVRAFTRLQRTHPDTRLVVAGGGRDAHLRDIIAAAGLADRVELAGFVPDIMPLLLRSHALLMCSRNEAMGRVTVEAMASGLPVIGHASGGTVELVRDGCNGLLYPGGEEALAARMAELADDPARARQLGEQGMRDVAERFSTELCAREVLEVYRKLHLPAQRSS